MSTNFIETKLIKHLYMLITMDERTENEIYTYIYDVKNTSI